MGLYDNFRTQDSQYIPQYTGLPLDTVERVGNQLQESHYSNLASLNQLQLLGMEQKNATPFGADRDKIQNHIDDVSRALQDLASNGAEHATTRVAALANHFLGNEELQRLRHNAQEYRKDEAQIRELRQKGATPIRNERDLTSWMEHGSYDPETGGLREYKSSVQAQLNHMGKQDEVVQPLQADTNETDLKAAAKTSLVSMMKAQGKWKAGMDIPEDQIMSHMPAFLQSDTYKQLTKDKVNNYLFGPAKNANGQIIDGLGWNNYKGTAEYKQQRDILGLSDEQIKAQLQGRGEAKVFSDHTKQFLSNSAGIQAAGLRGSGTKDKPEGWTPTYSELFKAPQGSLQVDENGQIVKMGKEFTFKDLFSKAKEAWQVNGDKSDLGAATNLASYVPAAIEAGIKYMFNNKSTLTPAQKDELKSFEYGLSRENATRPADKQKTLTQYVSELTMDNNIPINLFGRKETIENESGKFFNEKTGGGDYLTRKVYTTDGQTMTADEFYRDDSVGLGIDPTDEKQLKDLKDGVSIIGIADPKNESPFSRAKVGTRNGKTFLIDDSANATATEQYLHDTYSFGRQHASGTVQTVDPDTGKPIKVTGSFVNGSFVVDKIEQ